MNNRPISDGLVEELGRVVGCYDGGVWVEVQRQAACGSCSARHGCGSAQLSRLSRKPPLRFSMNTSLNLQRGDQVRLGLKATDIARASLLAYGVPLLLALVGAVIGQLGSGSDIWAGLGFMVGLGAGGVWLRTHHLTPTSRYLPQLLEVVRCAENTTQVAEPFDVTKV
ncbi:SoxR reducing system RseC family protein [Halomonas halocynthiae]|uniref:SoxR reducing system RseC family protein n=1 Tax=Halomonas halocynthiae TaxID=176290 RepID=UPI0004156C1E|nr:SoxR reducing system RseC family protein [Halomonas halocynthiae]